MRAWLMAEVKAITAPSEQARYALDMAESRITLVERTLAGPKQRGDAVHGAPDFRERIAALRGRVARRKGAEAPVDILLPPNLTLSKIETFPAEAKRQLRDEAWWRLERMTPFQPDELCYDVAIVDVEPTTGFLDVNVAVAPRDIVDEAIRYAQEWGFAPQRVSASEPMEGFAQGPLFLAAANKLQETRSMRRIGAALAAATVLFACLGVARGVMERQALATQLEAAAAQAEAEVRAGAAHRDAAMALAAAASGPITTSKAAHAPASWITALSVSAPPNTVISRVLMTDGRVRIEGASPDADAALAALDTSAFFEDARHAAPVRRAASGGLEVYAIEATIAPPSPAEPTGGGAALGRGAQ